jgi:Leucine-rich repeat (LRR) protein
LTSQALSVRNNKLTAVPASLGQLSMLQVLDLQHNSISSFASVAKLEKLENLDIQYNNLETLPQGTPLATDGHELYLSRAKFHLRHRSGQS